MDEKKNELTVEDLERGKEELLGFDPTDDRECSLMVAGNGNAISLVDPAIITENMAITAVTSCPYSIQYIPRKMVTNAVMMAAICTNADVVGFIAKLGLGNEDIYVEAIRRNWRLLKNLTAVATRYMCIEAVMSDGMALKYVPLKFRDLEVCKIAVDNQPIAFAYATTQDADMAMVAIKADRDNLKYVINQTDEICETAVRIDGTALQFVRSKTPKICAIAFMENAEAVQYIPAEVMQQVVNIVNEANAIDE